MQMLCIIELINLLAKTNNSLSFLDCDKIHSQLWIATKLTQNFGFQRPGSCSGAVAGVVFSFSVFAGDSIFRHFGLIFFFPFSLTSTFHC